MYGSNCSYQIKHTEPAPNETFIRLLGYATRNPLFDLSLWPDLIFDNLKYVSLSFSLSSAGLCIAVWRFIIISSGDVSKVSEFYVSANINGSFDYTKLSKCVNIDLIDRESWCTYI